MWAMIAQRFFLCFFQNSTTSLAICLPLPFSPLTYWLRTWCMILGLAWLAWNHSAFYCLQYHLLSQYTTPSLWYVNLHSGKVSCRLVFLGKIALDSIKKSNLSVNLLYYHDLNMDSKLALTFIFPWYNAVQLELQPSTNLSTKLSCHWFKD